MNVLLVLFVSGAVVLCRARRRGGGLIMTPALIFRACPRRWAVRDGASRSQRPSFSGIMTRDPPPSGTAHGLLLSTGGVWVGTPTAWRLFEGLLRLGNSISSFAALSLLLSSVGFLRWESYRFWRGRPPKVSRSCAVR